MKIDSKRKALLVCFVAICSIWYSCKSYKKEVSKNNEIALGSSNKLSQKPNVVFILVDDLGYGDLSCLGQKKLKTPNIDKLAEEGMIFTNHYSGNTVCSPSRAVLMTGQDPGHVYCRTNGAGVALDSSMTTLPEVFKSAGYKTGAYGKWGLGNTTKSGNQNPLNHGFDEFYGTRTQVSAHTYFTDQMVHNGKIETISKDVYIHDLIIDHALEFIENSVLQKTPFFCYIPTPIPHAAMHAPKDIHEKWRKKFPEFDSKIGTYGAGKGETCPDVINPIAGFAAMMETLDNEVGRIVKTLKNLGVDDNTIIVFTSDNGSHHEGGHDPEFWNSNGDFRGHKRELYEGGIHTPLIVRWPEKVTAGSTSNHISAFWDFLPTISDIINEPIPEQVNGISMLPTLLDNPESQKAHEFLLFEYTDKKNEIVAQAVRIGDWKVLRDSRKLKKDERENTPIAKWPIELYNLSDDIGETSNLVDKNPQIVNKAMRIMNEERVDLNVVLESRN